MVLLGSFCGQYVLESRNKKKIKTNKKKQKKMMNEHRSKEKDYKGGGSCVFSLLKGEKEREKGNGKKWGDERNPKY